MNVLFMTLVDFQDLEERNIYTDLLREFLKNNHKIFIVSPVEKRKNQKTTLIEKENYKILKLEIGNIQKTNLIEKGISTLTLESKFKQGIKNYFSDIKFDLILYSTPPITLVGAIKYIKNRDNAKTYLLLKDIFPQNALDLGMMNNKGPKSFLYKYFKNKEKKLYELSDYIGCMSPANVDFILKNNKEIEKEKVEVSPNTIEPIIIHRNEEEIRKIKIKYSIPEDRIFYIYGGNLGKPQGIDFMLQCLKSNSKNNKIFTVIVGSGTEYEKIEFFLKTNKIENCKLISHLPKKEYEVLASAADVGLIFLDNRFTIPNFPSRLLSYMELSIPILACTDKNTDIGKIIEENNFGLWCESTDVNEFSKKIKELENVNTRKIMGKNSREYLEKHYTVKNSYEIIIKHFK